MLINSTLTMKNIEAKMVESNERSKPITGYFKVLP